MRTRSCGTPDEMQKLIEIKKQEAIKELEQRIAEAQRVREGMILHLIREDLVQGVEVYIKDLESNLYALKNS